MGLNPQKLTKTNFIPLFKKTLTYFAALALNCGPRALFLAVAYKLLSCGMWKFSFPTWEIQPKPLAIGAQNFSTEVPLFS